MTDTNILLMSVGKGNDLWMSLDESLIEDFASYRYDCIKTPNNCYDPQHLCVKVNNYVTGW